MNVKKSVKNNPIVPRKRATSTIVGEYIAQLEVM
jgi:hypothetical protein